MIYKYDGEIGIRKLSTEDPNKAKDHATGRYLSFLFK